MRDVLVTGFALFTDDPCNSNREHCLEADVKVFIRLFLPAGVASRLSFRSYIHIFTSAAPL